MPTTDRNPERLPDVVTQDFVIPWLGKETIDVASVDGIEHRAPATRRLRGMPPIDRARSSCANWRADDGLD